MTIKKSNVKKITKVRCSNPEEIIKGKFRINKIKNFISKDIEYFEKYDDHQYDIYQKFGFSTTLGFHKDLLEKLQMLKNDADLKIISDYLEDVSHYSTSLLKKIWEK